MRSPFHTHFKTMGKHLFHSPCPFVHLFSLNNSFTEEQLLTMKYYFTRRNE